MVVGGFSNYDFTYPSCCLRSKSKTTPPSRSISISISRHFVICYLDNPLSLVPRLRLPAPHFSDIEARTTQQILHPSVTDLVIPGCPPRTR